MITKNERELIRLLIQDPKFRIVEQVAKDMVQQLRDTSNLRSSEWETAAATVMEEGQVQGINTLIQELYKLANDNSTQ